MERRFNLFRILKRLFLWVAVFAISGWLLDAFWLTLSVGLAAVVIWHTYFLQRLNKWLWYSRTVHPPRAPGVWGDIYDGIYLTIRRTQVRRRSLALILKRFRQASEALPDAVMILEEDGDLVWCNKLAQIYFGFRWPADQGIPVTNLIRLPKFRKYFDSRSFKEAITIRSPIAKTRELEVRIMPYGNDQLLLIARDVSQIRKLERMRKDFVANVSHELKTPLTVMQGYLEMMSDSDNLAPERKQKAIRDMSAQTQRMQSMIEQLMQLSRIETQAQEDFTGQVKLSELVSGILNSTRILTEDKKQQLEESVESDIVVLGDSEKLGGAVQNLITNAIKYTPEAGKIEVTLKQTSQGVLFSVQDNGPGIAPEHLPRLTERFYRVDDDRNRDTGGSGLGLAIVKHALEHHRAQLQVESEPDKGSRFYFVLPAELTV